MSFSFYSFSILIICLKYIRYIGRYLVPNRILVKFWTTRVGTYFDVLYWNINYCLFLWLNHLYNSSVIGVDTLTCSIFIQKIIIEDSISHFTCIFQGVISFQSFPWYFPYRKSALSATYSGKWPSFRVARTFLAGAATGNRIWEILPMEELGPIIIV